MAERSIGRYQILGELGRGAMGLVHRGHDPILDRPVAVKTLHVPDALPLDQREEFTKRFLLEARIAGKLLHPNIVVIHDAQSDEATGEPFIAMELVEGESLSQRLANRGRFDWDKALELILPLTEALALAHQEGIVHRDIKPSNVLLTASGVPKIADFGVAKLDTVQMTRTGAVIGSPHFMSPEQLQGEAVDGRSDLFSIGALLYNLIAGERAFKGTDLRAVASQILFKDPEPVSKKIPGIPPPVDWLIGRAMAKKLDERYASAEQMLEDLRLVRDGKMPRWARAPASDTEPPTLASARVEQWPSQDDSPTEREERLPLLKPEPAGRARYVVGAAALFLALGAGAWFTMAPDPTPVEPLSPSVATDSAIEAGPPAAPPPVEPNELGLPLLFPAQHDHRIGECYGTLTLNNWGIEFRSSDHRWSWLFNELPTMRRESARTLHLVSAEGDLFGLVSEKRYNFELAEPLSADVWEAYRRLSDAAR